MPKPRPDLHAQRRTSYWDTAVRIAALKGLPCNRHDLPDPLPGETPSALVARWEHAELQAQALADADDQLWRYAR